jgi:hypothetical protein
MNIWKSIVGLIVTSLLSVPLWAQGNTCEEQLNAATAEYDAGRFYSIPSMLKPCLDKGFSREQRQRAYLLLTQTYLLLEDPIGADNSYLELLRANPEFLPDTALHQIDVVYLSKKFTADPIFSVYGKVGGNTSIARVINSLYTYTSPNSPTRDDYKLMPGFQLGGGGDWNFFGQLSLTAEVNYSLTVIKRERSGIFGKDILESTDRQNWVSVPLMLKYSDNIGKIRPFGYAGYSVSYLLADNLKVTYKNRDDNTASEETGDLSTEEYESPSRKYRDARNLINQSIVIGGGIRVKTGLNFWFVDLRYSVGLNNLVKEDEVFNTAEIDRSGHVDDFMRIDVLSLSVGYVFPQYNPRKLKKARTKGILRRIKKQSDEG